MLSTIISPMFSDLSSFWILLNAWFCSSKLVGFRRAMFFKIAVELLLDSWFILSSEKLPSVSMKMIFLALAWCVAACIMKFDLPVADGP